MKKKEKIEKKKKNDEKKKKSMKRKKNDQKREIFIEKGIFTEIKNQSNIVKAKYKRIHVVFFVGTKPSPLFILLQLCSTLKLLNLPYLDKVMQLNEHFFNLISS